MNASLFVARIDAGVALLCDVANAQLIEYPSSLLIGAGISVGDILNISCTRDTEAERTRQDAFWRLQEDIMNQYGARTPTTPQLSVRNVTQTSVTLEWTRLELATATLVDLAIYRNGVRLASIPSPTTNTSSKVSGLDVDAEYSFHLVAKTTAGTHQSPAVRVRTHSMTNCAGVRVVFGHVDPPELLEQARAALERIGGQSTDKIESLVTTHFVCTASGSSGSADAAYQRALQLSLPTVLPSWLLACDTMQRLAPVQPHYLGTSTATRSTVSVAKPVSSTPNAEPPSVPSGGTSAAATSGGGAVEPASIGASEGTVGSVKAVPPLTSPADPESSGDAAD